MLTSAPACRSQQEMLLSAFPFPTPALSELRVTYLFIIVHPFCPIVKLDIVEQGT